MEKAKRPRAPISDASDEFDAVDLVDLVDEVDEVDEVDVGGGLAAFPSADRGFEVDRVFAILIFNFQKGRADRSTRRVYREMGRIPRAMYRKFAHILMYVWC